MNRVNVISGVTLVESAREINVNETIFMYLEGTNSKNEKY
jgi:hypothetical protein